MDQREDVDPQQYLPRDVANDGEPLQLLHRASLQNKVGHDASITNTINRLGQNNNGELSSEQRAEADF